MRDANFFSFFSPKKGPSQLNGINELTDLPLEMMYSTNHQGSRKTRTAGTKNRKKMEIWEEKIEKDFSKIKGVVY